MTHVFLAGEIQIGKSTVIQNTVQLLNLKYGGFRTYFGADRGDPNRRLYINRASRPMTFDDSRVVARFSPVSPPSVFSKRFDTLGAKYIAEAGITARLIIMDELGNMENSALRFQSAVLDALDGEVPILGVVKLSAAGWVEDVRNHPKVALVTVDMHNRDELPLLLRDSLQHYDGAK